jgi:lysophospholipase L1-like esterase
MAINKQVSTQYQGLIEEAANPQDSGLVNAYFDSILSAPDPVIWYGKNGSAPIWVDGIKYASNGIKFTPVLQVNSINGNTGNVVIDGIELNKTSFINQSNLTGKSISTNASSISGWGTTFTNAGLSGISAISIARVTTTAGDANKWAVLTVNVRTSRNGTIIATGSYPLKAGVTNYNDIVVRLLNPSKTAPITLNSELSSGFWVEYYAKTFDDVYCGLAFSSCTKNPQQISSVAGSVYYILQVNGVWTATAGGSLYNMGIEFLIYDSSDYMPVVPAPRPVLNLAPTIWAVPTRECNIYFNGLSNVKRDNVEWDLSFAAGLGKQQNERFTFIPSIAGSNTLTISTYDKVTAAQIATASTTIVSADTTHTGTITALFIGDSTTAGGEVVTEVNAIKAGYAGLTLSTIGTKGTGANKHEGISGWALSTFLTNSGSPFWDGTTYNPSFYLSTNSLPTPSTIIINLGINDIFSITTDAEAYAAAQTFCSNMQIFINGWYATSSTIKFGMALTTAPSIDQDAFGSNYNCDQSEFRYRRNWSILLETLISIFGNQAANGIYLLPYNTAIDSENNMLTQTVAVNSRNSTNVIRQSNGVHPASSGYYQIADACFAWLMNLI